MNPENNNLLPDVSTGERDLLPLIADARVEQQCAICSRKGLVVVSAGAGTGKTHTLARRFAWLLATDPTCRVDQILTLTFTQLAAAEMRERIKSTLVQWYAEYGERLPHLADAIERIDEAYISTIHSFALRVVRESGLSLDIDPAAAMVSEPEEREFWTDMAWNFETLNADRIGLGLDETWRARARELIGDPSFVDFSNYFSASVLAKLAQDAEKLHGSMNARPEVLWDFDQAMETRIRENLDGLLAGERRETWKLWHDVVFPSIRDDLRRGKENQFLARIRALFETWGEAERSPESERGFYIDLIGSALKSLPGQSGLKTAIEEAIGSKLTDWRNDDRKKQALIMETLLNQPGYTEEEAVARRLLMRTAALGWACWEQARERSGMLSFSDLIRFAGDAVANDPSYANKFRHIMIDEFQDTDGLQENLISSLRNAWSGGGERRSLFVVGDIKQSIYRFRHANPKLFAEYIRMAETGADGEHIPLSCSYRMSGKMMEDANTVFDRIWEAGVIGGDQSPSVRYEPLEAPADAPWWRVRNEDAEHSPALELILAVPDDAEEKQEEDKGSEKKKILMRHKRVMLAAALAGKLKQMIADETPVWDKSLTAEPDERKLRPMRWGDIAILVPTRTQYPVLEEVFEGAGISALFGGGREYFNRGEVRDLINLLRLLDRPNDDFALTGWMESPFSGLPPESGLAMLAKARLSKAKLSVCLAEEYPESMARLTAMRRKARAAGSLGALLFLLENPEWLGAYADEARAKVLANIRRGCDLVREYEAVFGRNLSSCADYLGRTMRDRAQVEEANPSDGISDVLRVMTVHASKGLEFPVVVLMGLEDSVKKEKRSLSANASRTLGAIASKLPRLPLGANSEDEEIDSVTALWHSFVETCEQVEEKERLLYVAMTRAQERLICCGIAPDKIDTLESSDSWLGWLAAANSEAGSRFPATNVIVRADAHKEIGFGAAPGRSGEDERKTPVVCMLPESPVVRLERLSASAYSLLSWCPFAYRMRYRQGREMLWEMPEGDGYGGADLGTLAHWVLSRWDLKAGTLARYLRPEQGKGELEEYLRSLPAYLRPVYSSGSTRKVLYGWLSAFAETDACRELREVAASGNLRSELSFRVPFEDTRLVGSIDVFWEDASGCHIRDWKITPEKSAPEEMYLNQIEFYALAVHAVRPNASVDAGLLYLRPRAGAAPGGEDAVKLIEDWAVLGESVKAAARTAAAGPFPHAVHRCRCCPFSKFCRAGA